MTWTRFSAPTALPDEPGQRTEQPPQTRPPPSTRPARAGPLAATGTWPLLPPRPVPGWSPGSAHHPRPEAAPRTAPPQARSPARSYPALAASARRPAPPPASRPPPPPAARLFSAPRPPPTSPATRPLPLPAQPATPRRRTGQPPAGPPHWPAGSYPHRPARSPSPAGSHLAGQQPHRLRPPGRRNSSGQPKIHAPPLPCQPPPPPKANLSPGDRARRAAPGFYCPAHRRAGPNTPIRPRVHACSNRAVGATDPGRAGPRADVAGAAGPADQHRGRATALRLTVRNVLGESARASPHRRQRLPQDSEIRLPYRLLRHLHAAVTFEEQARMVYLGATHDPGTSLSPVRTR